MTEGNSEHALQLEDLLRRLEAARQALMDTIQDCPADGFEVEIEEMSVKRALERTADDLNFYYGSLAARALNLPQAPCMQPAEFSSIREAAMSLQVAHRRFSNLVHDLLPTDLDKIATDQEHGTYTLRQILEMTTAQYNYRAQQVQRLATQAAGHR